MSRYRFIPIVVVLSSYVSLVAQPVHRELSVESAVQTALARNAGIAVVRADVRSARGSLLQASTGYNPSLAIEYNLFNRTNGKWLDFNNGANPSQQTASIDTKIDYSGTVGGRTSVAEKDVEVNETILTATQRLLVAQVQRALVDIQTYARQRRITDGAIDSLRTMITAMESMRGRGVYAEQELLRIGVLGYQLERTASDIRTNERNAMGALRVLLGDSTDVVYDVAPFTTRPATSLPDTLTEPSLLSLAMRERPDLAINRIQRERELANLGYQKRLAWPDLRMGLTYDKQGSSWPDYMGLTMSLELPFFDRNQGGIEISQANIERSDASYRAGMESATQDIRSALASLRESTALLQRARTLDNATGGERATTLLNAYRARALGFIEFVDLYQAIVDASIMSIEAERHWYNSLIDLNVAAGTTVLPIN